MYKECNVFLYKNNKLTSYVTNNNCYKQYTFLQKLQDLDFELHLKMYLINVLILYQLSLKVWKNVYPGI